VLSEVNPDGRAAIRRTELLWRNDASDRVPDGGESAGACRDFLLVVFPLDCRGQSQGYCPKQKPELILWNNLLNY
jgi:hypothetical protein